MRYKILTTVKSVENVKQVVSGRKVKDADGQDETVLEYEDLGWFVVFEGSWEKLNFGTERPNLKKGQKVEIIIQGL